MKSNLKLRDSNFRYNLFIVFSFFYHAAASKLFDFENFRIQLGQSPVLVFANWISIAVPFLFIIAFVLESV
jgi:hypothetical protein